MLVLLLTLACCLSLPVIYVVKVMELCSGGELFDQIVSRGHFSEQDAVGIMRSLLDFVAFAHSKHIVHRWVQLQLLAAGLLLSTCQRTPLV